MEAILQFIKRRQKHYKTAIGDHLITLHEALEVDTKQRLHQLSLRSITITVPPPPPETSPAASCQGDHDDDSDEDDASTRTTKLSGFKVANLPDSRLNERIVLTEMGTTSQQVVSRGSIIGIGDQVIIRLDKPIDITFPKNRDDSREDDNDSFSSCVFKIKLDERDILNRRVRVEAALRKFEHVSCSLALHKCLLGNFKDLANNKFKKSRATSLNTTSLKLKGAQLKAVEQSMRKRISLIEGVAGSGKTLVAASLAYSMCRYRDKKILLCSPIQATVDKLAQLLMNATDYEVRVIKLGGSNYNNDADAIRSIVARGARRGSSATASENGEGDGCELQSLVKAELYWDSRQRLERVATGYPPPRGLTPVAAAQQLHRLANRLAVNSSPWRRRRVERKLLRKANIVCCTLIQAGNPCLRGLNFDMLIIDDLQAAPETDCMVAMMARGLKQVTLISEMRREIRSARSKGGHLQSRPDVGVAKPEIANGNGPSVVARNKKQARNGRPLRVADNKLMKSRDLVVKQAREPGGLFERFLSMGLSAIALRNQFRMHETLAALPNHHFYLSRLKTDKKTNEELTKQICNSGGPNQSDDADKFNWLPNSKCLTAFFNTISSTTTHGGSSTVVETVDTIINRLVSKEGVHKSRIGIIINEHSHDHHAIKSNFDGIDMGTVDDFLGQERDFIVMIARRGDNDDKITANGERGDTKEPTTTTKTAVANTIDCDYLRDEDALLIALTRARLGLFIVAELPLNDFASDCQTQTSEKQVVNRYCESWKALVRYYKANKLVI